MYLNYKRSINNSFADRTRGSRFPWTLSVELDKACRVDAKFWAAQFQLSELGTDMSAEYLGSYVSDTEQRCRLSHECA